jgi:hypothetical protein
VSCVRALLYGLEMKKKKKKMFVKTSLNIFYGYVIKKELDIVLLSFFFLPLIS